MARLQPPLPHARCPLHGPCNSPSTASRQRAPARREGDEAGRASQELRVPELAAGRARTRSRYSPVSGPGIAVPSTLPGLVAGTVVGTEMLLKSNRIYLKSNISCLKNLKDQYVSQT